jgi:hypothetical protein
MDLPEEAVSWPDGSSLRAHPDDLERHPHPCHSAGSGHPRLRVQRGVAPAHLCQGFPGTCAMTPQIPLEQILRGWVSSPNATVATRILGISRRTLYDRLEKASLMERRDAFAMLQAEAEGQLATLRTQAAQSLLATEAHVTDLTRQVDTLC